MKTFLDMNGRKKMRSKVSLLCLPAIIKFKLNIKFRLSILGGRINYDYPGSVKLISYNFSVIFIFSFHSKESILLEIFFFPGPINRAFYAILASVKSWTAIKTGREMSLSGKTITLRRLERDEWVIENFFPFPLFCTIRSDDFQPEEVGQRSIDVVFLFFFFFEEITRIIILILSRKLWTEKDRLLLSTVFVEKKNFLEMRYLYNFFNYSFELE